LLVNVAALSPFGRKWLNAREQRTHDRERREEERERHEHDRQRRADELKDQQPATITVWRSRTMNECMQFDRSYPWASMADVTSYAIIRIDNPRPTKPYRLFPPVLDGPAGYPYPLMSRRWKGEQRAEGVELSPGGYDFFVVPQAHMGEEGEARLRLRTHEGDTVHTL
jgi:hypothetical protein